jgi:hypothetical protein
MNTYRRTAVVAGVLWILATVAGLASTVLLGPILGAPDYLARISANEGQVLLAALAQFILVVVVLLLLVTLSRESVAAGDSTSSAFRVPAVLLMAARDWLSPVAAVLTFGLGAIMYYKVFYRSGLVPRWLAAWGLVGAAILTVSGLLVLFRLAAPLGTVQTVMAGPIALQEIVLALWLIFKGFNASAITPAHERETSTGSGTAQAAGSPA